MIQENFVPIFTEKPNIDSSTSNTYNFKLLIFNLHQLPLVYQYWPPPRLWWALKRCLRHGVLRDDTQLAKNEKISNSATAFITLYFIIVQK